MKVIDLSKENVCRQRTSNGGCLSQVGCYSKIPGTDSFNNKCLFLIVLEASNPKSRYQHGWVLVRAGPACCFTESCVLAISSHG